MVEVSQYVGEKQCSQMEWLICPESGKAEYHLESDVISSHIRYEEQNGDAQVYIDGQEIPMTLRIRTESLKSIYL